MEIDVAGPASITGTQDTPSRRRIFTCHPTAAAQEEACARQIWATLPAAPIAVPEDMTPLLHAYASERAASGEFERGIEAGVAALLVSPLPVSGRERSGRRRAGQRPPRHRPRSGHPPLAVSVEQPARRNLLRLAETHQLHRPES
jgi:hypothetical protein